MQKIYFFLWIISLSSCNYFEKKKVYSEDILQENLKTLNWHEVDIYPKFAVCDSIIKKEESKTCFQNTLITHVNSFLALQKIEVEEDVNDTIKLKIEINKKGIATVKSIDLKAITRQQIPNIDHLLQQSLDKMPQIYPAIKHGQQVTTAFTLPVVIKIK